MVSFIASLEPDEQLGVLRKAGEKIKERYEKDCKQILEDGVMIFAKRPPAERLKTYRENTLPEDIPLVLDPDYPQKRLMQQAPPLMAELVLMQREQMMVQYQQQQMATQDANQALEKDGMTMLPPAPPQLPQAPNLWPDLLPLPDIFWRHFSRDFMTLEKNDLRKMGLL